MQHEQPPIVFEGENIRGVGLSAAHLVAGGGRDVFQTRHPGDRSLDFNRYFRDVDPHEAGASKNLFPACADILPTGQAVPVRVDADGAAVGRPHFVHQIDIKAFESEIEFEVGFYHLFRIGHILKES